MHEPGAEEQRFVLSMHYADIVATYQQDHRALMDALADPEISIERFDALSAQLREDLNNLKRIKVELQAQRTNLRSADGADAGTPHRATR